jgi:hypothetical protein
VLEKFLTRFSEGRVSYGVPVGPAASRPLGEAVLIDIDSTLLSYGIDFVRFVDDFVIFADKPEEAGYGVRVLGETLFRNHGLSLQTSKTRVLPIGEYVEKHLTVHSEKEEARRTLLSVFGSDYDVTTYNDLTDEQKEEVDAFNLSEMLREALAQGEGVDFREVSFILGRLSVLQKPELIPIVLENLERLYPVAHSIASFFKGFLRLPPSTRREVAEKLLGPMLGDRRSNPSEYYCMWTLSIFQHSRDWDHADQLLAIFRETNSDAIRRFAALALATTGTRSQAMTVKEYVSQASPLCRTAILLATARLGGDERAYLRKSLRLTDRLEKLCANATI